MPLSPKTIPARDRLIVALDVEDTDRARRLVDELGDAVSFYKIGLGLAFDRGFWALFDHCAARGKRTFADVKFFDVPETVKSAVRTVVRSGAAFATVHAQEAMIAAAVEGRAAAGGSPGTLKILAVTVLTSLDQGDVNALGFGVNVEDLVLSRAQRVLACGADGLISSGLELPRLRGALGDRFLIVVPGIRPVVNKTDDDQKRTVDIEAAFETGADYIVVGRPIRSAPDPRAAAEAVQQRIAKLFPAV